MMGGKMVHSRQHLEEGLIGGVDKRKKETGHSSDREAHLLLLYVTAVYDWTGRPDHLL